MERPPDRVREDEPGRVLPNLVGREPFLELAPAVLTQRGNGVEIERDLAATALSLGCREARHVIRDGKCLTNSQAGTIEVDSVPGKAENLSPVAGRYSLRVSTQRLGGQI